MIVGAKEIRNDDQQLGKAHSQHGSLLSRWAYRATLPTEGRIARRRRPSGASRDAVGRYVENARRGPVSAAMYRATFGCEAVNQGICDYRSITGSRCRIRE